MDRRRVVAAVFFSAVVVAVLGVMVYLEQARGHQTVSVFILRHSVVGGGRYSADDVTTVSIRAQEGDFTYEHRSPTQYAARYTQSLRAGDIVREDDLSDLGAQVVVALTVQSAPQISPGDRVDLFATVDGSRQARIGASITVLTASGGALTVLVPAGQEEDWISVASSSTVMHAALTSQDAPAAPPPMTAGDAISSLCGAACAVTTTAPSAVP